MSRTISTAWRLIALAPAFAASEAARAGDTYTAPYEDHSYVGDSFRAYRAGIGHTVAPVRRRSLDGSISDRPAPYQPEPQNEPVTDWSGTYFGATAGGLFATTDLDGGIADEIDANSYVLSGHVGKNYQIGSVVFSPEVDLSLTSADDTVRSGGGTNAKSELDWLSSARLRAGYTFDNLLIYGTGGLALTTTNVQITAPGFKINSKEFHAGYVVGAGAEMEIVDGIHGRVEALHYGFSGDTLPTPAGASDLDLDITTVRAGVSLKFK